MDRRVVKSALFDVAGAVSLQATTSVKFVFRKELGRYDALFGAMGGKLSVQDQKGRLIYTHDGGRLMVTKPIDGEPATGANGGTIGFEVDSLSKVTLGTKPASRMVAPRSRTPLACTKVAQAVCISASRAKQICTR